jgi:uncharacterized protein YbaP (TraB family)
MRTRKSLVPCLLVMLALAVVLPLRGQSAGTNATELHPLWKVQGRTNTVYLLGSIHLLKKEDYPLARPIEAAFEASSVVAFETDMEEMQKPQTQFRLLSKAGLPDGKTLKDFLSAAVYAEFRKKVEDAGLMMLMFEHMQPAMAALTLEVLELQRLGLDPDYGVDKYFFERARKEGRKLVALETVDFQISLITDFTKEEGEMLVKTTLEEIENTKKLFGEMQAAWRTGDAVKLEKLLNEVEEQAPVIFRRLVTDRNRRWVPKIEELLTGGRNAIVIVGAGHLVGSEGVVELLRKKGLKVTQL